MGLFSPKQQDMQIQGQAVTVRQFVVDDVFDAIETVVTLLPEFADMTEDTPVSDILARLGTTMLKRERRVPIYRLLSIATGVGVEDIRNLPMTDLMRLIKAALEVNDAVELRQLFFEMKATITLTVAEMRK